MGDPPRKRDVSLLRAAEGSVLQNMGDASVVVGIRLEANGKYIVLVVPCDVDVIGARLVMLKLNGGKLKFRDTLGALDGEAVKFVAGLGKLGEIGQSSIRASLGVDECSGAAAGNCLASERKATSQHREVDDEWVMGGGGCCRGERPVKTAGCRQPSDVTANRHAT